MSDVKSSDFYAVLGVERSADARTIKKAYFALVRKYPPETKPEEFQKIREAYEVLSNPDARRDYDSIGAFGAQGGVIGEQMELALKAMEEQRFADAQTVLIALLKDHPDLAFARDLLGLAYLRQKKFPNAQAVFDELVAKHPDNGAFVLHQGYARHALKQFAQAEASFRKAAELDKEDVRPLVALADCLMDQAKWDESLKVLDGAIHLDGSVDFRDFALFTRKLEVETERGNAPGINQVLAELKKIIPQDEAARRFVANRLSALAAPLFARKKTDLANLLMREAAALDPKRGAGQMPTSFTLEIDTLPQASKDWLAAQAKQRSFMKVDGSPRVGPIFGILAVLAGLFFGFVMAFGSRRPMDAAGMVMFWLVMVGLGALAVWSVRRLIVIGRSPYGAYTTVHPFYLVQVNVNKLTAWPLANLHDARITHRYTNGVYNGSTINLIFSRRTFTTNVYGKEKAVEWANTVLAKRKRMLELMFSGLTEAGGAEAPLVPADMIPDEGRAVPPTPAALEEKKKFRVGLAIAAGIATVLTVALIPMNAVKKEKRAWDDANFAYRNKVEAYDLYLKEYPSGRHADQAKQAIDAIYAQAEVKIAAHGDSEMAPALTELIKVLKAKRSTRVGIKYESKTLFEKLDLSKFPEDLANSITDPRPAFTAKANAAREQRITSAIQAAFDRMLGNGVVTIGKDPYAYDYDYGDRYGKKKKEPEVEPPVSFVIFYDIALTGKLYESVKESGTKNDKKFLGVDFGWDFGLEFEDDKELKYTFKFLSEPAKNIRWTTYGYGSAYESPTLPYDKMADSAFDDFTAKLNRRFATTAEAAAYDDDGAGSDDGSGSGYGSPAGYTPPTKDTPRPKYAPAKYAPKPKKPYKPRSSP